MSLVQRATPFAACRALVAGLLLLAGSRALSSTNLFTSGQNGYNTYRIPTLYETTNGVLLAFCEGRKNSSSDTGDIDTLLRRSFDGGLTWTTQQVVWSDGANTCGNPTVVQDRTNGRIWLFLTWNNGQDTQAAIQAGTSIDVRKIYSCFSDDSGATWSAPVSRFGEVQPPTIRWDATGPGRGIQIVSGSYPGRLIIPANGRNIQSDDHGLTWSQSTWLPGGSSESQEVEISGGVLLRNDRATGGNAAYNARIFCRSANQGASWGALEIRQDLPCPVCQASTIAVAHPDGMNGRMLVFANPSATTRVNMTIQCSLDDGVTWPFSRQVYSGSSAYCCLTPIGSSYVGLLYERDSYGRITFDKFAVDQLAPSSRISTWDGGGADVSWGTAANWTNHATPTFDSGLDVVFHSVGAGKLTNAIGADRTIRSLTFNADADSDVGIYLAEAISSPATNLVLTFAAGGGSATNTVATGAAGSFTIGVGGSGGPGSITLADNLIVNHNGSGELRFDRPISGPGGITKLGSGRLYLRQSNLYTGSTAINAGTVITGGNTGAFGDATTSGPLYLNGGTVANSTAASRPVYNNVTMGGDFTVGGVAGYGAGLLTFSGSFNLGGAARTLTINSPVTLSGAVSNGGLAKSGPETLTLAGVNTYTGQTVVYAGTLQLGDGAGSGSLDAATAIAIGPGGIFQFSRTNNLSSFANNLSGIGTLIKTNTGELGLTGTNSFSGTLDIQQGKLGLSGAACVNGAPDVNVASAGTLSVGSGFLGGVANIGNLSGQGRIDPVYGQGTAVRTLQVNQDADTTFSGVIADGTYGRVLALTKVGPATLTLSGTNTYGGGTTVSNGALLANGALANSAVTVKAGATLGGNGSIGGRVGIESGGTLSPGTAIGTLTINGSLDLAGTTWMEVNPTNRQCDFVQGLTNLTYGGALVVSNVAGPANPPEVGQNFQLFAVPAARSGNFSSITPPLTGGRTWNFNPTNGMLSVVSGTATRPTNISCRVINGIVLLAWPSSHLGWIAQSNALNVANPANWLDIPGSSGVTNLNVIPSPARTSVFYRLRSP